MAFARCLEQAIDEARAEGVAKPAVAVLSGDVEVEEAARYLERRGIPSYTYSPERAVAALGAVYRYYRAFKGAMPISVEPAPPSAVELARKLFEEVRRSGRRVLTEYESKLILKAFGVPTTEDRLARNVEEALSYASSIGFPVALKVCSPEIVHKSDAGCVRTDLSSPQEVAEAFTEILKNASRAAPGSKILGVSVQTMAKKGHEVILGARKDVSFGHVIMFGLGGVFVELFRDLSFRLAPVRIEEAMEMIMETKASRLLRGFRGIPQGDISAAAEALSRASIIPVCLPEVEELDINPLIVHPQGAVAVDARIVIA
jgi:acetyltransferase